MKLTHYVFGLCDQFISADETDDEGDFRAYLEDEPEEVRNAWEELMMIQREQQRYSDIRFILTNQKSIIPYFVLFSVSDSHR